MRREVAAFRSSKGKSATIWFTSTPMPRMMCFTRSASAVSSVRMPAAFLPSIRMSLGHLISGRRSVSVRMARLRESGGGSDGELRGRLQLQERTEQHRKPQAFARGRNPLAAKASATALLLTSAKTTTPCLTSSRASSRRCRWWRSFPGRLECLCQSLWFCLSGSGDRRRARRPGPAAAGNQGAVRSRSDSRGREAFRHSRLKPLRLARPWPRGPGRQCPAHRRREARSGKPLTSALKASVWPMPARLEQSRVRREFHSKSRAMSTARAECVSTPEQKQNPRPFQRWRGRFLG